MSFLKVFIAAFLVVCLSSVALAGTAQECTSTWDNSSAAQSCGFVCTNPMNTFSYEFSSSYNTATDECSFSAGCCQGMPFQICSYNYAVCDKAAITVKRGDNIFYNDHGKLRKGQG